LKTILITGASRGLGHSLSELLPQTSDKLVLVSRNLPPSMALTDGVERHWIEQDIADFDAGTNIARAVPQVVDVVIHNAGIWERASFSDSYLWEGVSDDEDRRIVQVNLLAPMCITKSLLPHLRRSSNPKVILIGSTAGLDNSGCQAMAYAASKWGLRGMAHALREHVRRDGIGVTIINPGTIGAVIHDGKGDVIGAGIPPEDIVNIIRSLLDVSRLTEIKEIDLPAMADEDV
jgi:short-subunit dehydrogenase